MDGWLCKGLLKWMEWGYYYCQRLMTNGEWGLCWNKQRESGFFIWRRFIDLVD
jgi:hypothetical protein